MRRSSAWADSIVDVRGLALCRRATNAYEIRDTGGMGAKQSNGLWIVAGFHNANAFFREFHGKFHMFMARKEFLEDRVPGADLEPFHHATLHSQCVVLIRVATAGSSDSVVAATPFSIRVTVR